MQDWEQAIEVDIIDGPWRQIVLKLTSPKTRSIQKAADAYVQKLASLGHRQYYRPLLESQDWAEFTEEEIVSINRQLDLLWLEQWFKNGPTEYGQPRNSA